MNTNFKELFEMASTNGITQNGSSRRSEWEARDAKFVKLLHDKLPGKTRFYKYGNTYYLTTVTNDYIGYIEINDKIISKSHREPKRIKTGFYKFMFPLILSDIKEIQSDDSLSKSAIKAYETLSSISSIKITISDGTPFSVEHLLSDKKLRVSITESTVGTIHYTLESYYKKINQTTNLGSHTRPGDWMEMYTNNNEVLFTALFNN